MIRGPHSRPRARLPASPSASSYAVCFLNPGTTKQVIQIGLLNNYSSYMSVALMWYDPAACSGDGGNWATGGWWNLNPGQTGFTNIFMSSRYFAYYAEAVDGAVWDGLYGPVE